MDDPKDEIQFSAGQFSLPDPGVYRSPLQGKSGQNKALPVTSSRILNLREVQNTYNSFGLEGLKSILLQELVRLDLTRLQDELMHLAEGANEHRDIKRALRATKMLASQWLEDHRQPDDVKKKCQFIFDSISTFGTIQIEAPDSPAVQMGDGVQVMFPGTGPLEPVNAEMEHHLNKGASLLFMTDVQGHYLKLENLVVNLQLAQHQGSILHWTAPPNFYLVLIGDLFNKSPYSSWGDAVGQDSFKLIKTLERFMKMAPENIMLSYGSYDLDLATKAAFYHPESGFMGKTLGVNAQAQAIPAVLSFIRGTSEVPPEHPDFAWLYVPEHDCFELAPQYQLHGVPYLTVPLNADRKPDIQPLLHFYQSLAQQIVKQQPRTIQEIDKIAGELIPEVTPQLNLTILKTSLGRCLHFEGLLVGSGTIQFLRERIAGLHIFQAGELEFFAMHPEIREATMDMLYQIKPLGAKNWRVPELEEFLRGSLTLVKRGIDPERLLAVLSQMRINTLNDWLAFSERGFYYFLVQNRYFELFVPEFIQQREENSFINAYRELRWALIREDPAGRVGYALGMEGIPRKGEPRMRKVSELEERSRRSYAKTFLMDLFRDELPFKIKITPEGIIAEYPEGEPEFLISLLIDPSVAIYKDSKDNLHMPVKHAAWIEYK